MERVRWSRVNGTKRVECVSAPLYVCWRDKKASLPNFLALELRDDPRSSSVALHLHQSILSLYLSLFLPFSFSCSLFLSFSASSQRAPSNEYSCRKQFLQSAETTENLYKEKFRREIDAISLKLESGISESC